MKLSSLIAGFALLALALNGCTVAPAKSEAQRAVIIVSGGGAVSPFTTPDDACKTGLAAGNSDTAIREALLKSGHQVFTAPAMDNWGKVVEPSKDSFEPFGDCPKQLPDIYTIMSVGDFVAGGDSLARFVMYLHDNFGINEVDFVGHSNGGLFSRAAIKVLKDTQAPVKIRSLVMVGTPNLGNFPSRYNNGEVGLEACGTSQFCIDYNTRWVEYAKNSSLGLDQQNTEHFLAGPNGWNAQQVGVLDGIPVTMLGGSYWEDPAGDPSLWPYDGIVPVSSALAIGVGEEVIPHRTCWVGALTHSIFISAEANLDYQTALTWNKEALSQIVKAIDTADTALEKPSGQGCNLD